MSHSNNSASRRPEADWINDKRATRFLASTAERNEKERKEWEEEEQYRRYIKDRDHLAAWVTAAEAKSVPDSTNRQPQEPRIIAFDVEGKRYPAGTKKEVEKERKNIGEALWKMRFNTVLTLAFIAQAAPDFFNKQNPSRHDAGERKWLKDNPNFISLHRWGGGDAMFGITERPRKERKYDFRHALDLVVNRSGEFFVSTETTRTKNRATTFKVSNETLAPVLKRVDAIEATQILWDSIIARDVDTAKANILTGLETSLKQMNNRIELNADAS